MPSRSSRNTRSLTKQIGELTLAVPQVVAHRVTRMVIASPTLSERDRKEFTSMISEKNIAFAQACQAMALQAARANQALAATFLGSMCLPAFWGKPSTAKSIAQAQSAAFAILGKGVAPIH